MTTLAMLGGTPAVSGIMAPFNTIGEAEAKQVRQVLETGVLSGFIGGVGPDFNGGPKVQRLEAKWREMFRSRHAISVNSATSGLFAAIGAAGISPGDEVIVPPYTMSATAMAPLVYGGIPVFVDIDAETFCLDLEKTRDAITPRTRAILAVNLFGHPARLHALRALADQRGLILIEDNAQAPLATEDGEFTGTIGHIGVFSLNRHKHVHTGEGGMCTTNDDTLAQRLAMIRNHGENVVDPFGVNDISNLIGFNYRLSELSAAVGLAQLERAEAIIDERCAIAETLTRGATGIVGFTPPHVREGCRHTYYVWTARVDEDVLGVSRALISQALAAEGFPNITGYVRPLYMLPAFQRRVAFGRDGWPFAITDRQYDRGLCPVTERMHEREVLEYPICSFSPTPTQIDQLVNAMHKVFENLDALRDHQRRTGTP